MIVITNVCPKSKTAKDLVREMFKEPVSEHLLTVNMLKSVPNTCEIYMRALLSYFSPLWGKMIWKMSLLVTRKILGAFVNSLAADGKYPLWNLRLRPFQFKCNYLKNEKFFSIFCSFLEYRSNFKYFAKRKKDCHN